MNRGASSRKISAKRKLSNLIFITIENKVNQNTISASNCALQIDQIERKNKSERSQNFEKKINVITIFSNMNMFLSFFEQMSNQF